MVFLPSALNLSALPKRLVEALNPVVVGVGLLDSHPRGSFGPLEVRTHPGGREARPCGFNRVERRASKRVVVVRLPIAMGRARDRPSRSRTVATCY